MEDDEDISAPQFDITRNSVTAISFDLTSNTMWNFDSWIVLKTLKPGAGRLLSFEPDQEKEKCKQHGLKKIHRFWVSCRGILMTTRNVRISTSQSGGQWIR